MCSSDLDGMGEDVTELVEGSRLALSTGLSLATDPVRALGAGGIQNAGDDFGAQAGLKVGAGDGAGEGGSKQPRSGCYTDYRPGWQ